MQCSATTAQHGAQHGRHAGALQALWVSSYGTSSMYCVEQGLDSGRSQKHAQMVSKLKGQSKVKADERDSFPKAIRSTSERPASVTIRPDEKPMARWGLKRSRSGLWRLLRLYTQRGRFGGRQGRQFSSFRGKHRLGQLSECMCRKS